MFTQRIQSCLASLGTVLIALPAVGAESNALPIVKDVEWQPLSAQVRRLIEATEYLGSAFGERERQFLNVTLNSTDSASASEMVQRLLDPYCLVGVNISTNSRVSMARGQAKPELVEQGWRVFLVKVANEAGSTKELRASSPNAQRLAGSPQEDVANRWLDLMMFNSQPLQTNLSGLKLEYRIIQLYSRDAGAREAKLAFGMDQPARNGALPDGVDVSFQCQPTHEVTFRVRDENNKPATASFVIKDRQGRIYPSQSKRLAPDFAFHPQIYRADGEGLKLPDGDYTVQFARGPESITRMQTITVNAQSKKFEFKVERWIDPSKMGWWSGDHHIHAAGCAHYTKPSEGVLATDMMRHCLGEDLKVGCNLTWGPCFDFQKQFFRTGVYFRTR